MTSLSENYVMVAALHIGKSHSIYAFSMRHDFKEDPLKIHVNHSWKSGGRALTSIKTPTCLLLDKDKQFLAFGYEAENMYADVVMDGKKEDHYYFHRFKMNLYKNKNITRKMVLEDVSGKTVPAVEVFKLIIQALVNDLLDTLQKQGTGFKKEEVRWVLVVPAIWTDKAKQLMRASAEEAGIPPHNLIIALKPETAAIYCRYLPIEKLQGTIPRFTMTTKGTQYMVAYIGGSTVELTVYQSASSGQLQELCRASENDCRGKSVNNRFFKMLDSIFGENVMRALKEEDPLSYLDLMREFKAVKRTIESQKTNKVNLTIPFVSLHHKCQKVHGKGLETVIESSPFSNEIKIFGDRLRINAALIRDLFESTIDKIISMIMEMLTNKSAKGVSILLMVGGFSECHLLQERIRAAFSGKRIIIPEEAGLSVVKGAVLFGHRPDYVKSRVTQFTYGVKTNVLFDERKHDAKHRVEMDGEDRCDNIFSIIIEKDQLVEAGTVVKKSYFTPYRNQEVMDFMVYTSTTRYPNYVDDDGCEFLCQPTIHFPETCEEKRWVDVEYIFGNTEISLKAIDRNSGKEITANFNLI